MDNHTDKVEIQPPPPFNPDLASIPSDPIIGLQNADLLVYVDAFVGNFLSLVQGPAYHRWHVCHKFFPLPGSRSIFSIIFSALQRITSPMESLQSAPPPLMSTGIPGPKCLGKCPSTPFSSHAKTLSPSSVPSSNSTSPGKSLQATAKFYPRW